MTPEIFLTLLKKNIHTNHIFSPKRRPPLKPRRDPSYLRKYYDIAHLDRFISELSALDDDYEYEEKFGARYLVNTEGRLLFTREGRAGKYVARHKDIANKCLAAGNIYFNEDYSQIIKINHESGDFHPTIESLVYPLAALLAVNPDIVSDTLDIEIILPSKEKTIINVDKTSILEALAEKLYFGLTHNQPWDEIRIDRYDFQRGKNPFTLFPHASKRAMIGTTDLPTPQPLVLDFDADTPDQEVPSAITPPSYKGSHDLFLFSPDLTTGSLPAQPATEKDEDSEQKLII